MTARPQVHPTTDLLHAALGPGFTAGDEPAGWPLVAWLDGPGRLLGEVDDLVRDTDTGPGWSDPLDLDRATGGQLAWLAQLPGVRLPGGLSDPARRQLIRDRSGWRRGTPAALVAAVKATLAGSRRVELIERDGTAYRARVRVYDSEVVDQAATEAAIAAEKPAGIVATLEILTGAPYDHFALVHGPTYADDAAAFPTGDDMITHVPE